MVNKKSEAVSLSLLIDRLHKNIVFHVFHVSSPFFIVGLNVLINCNIEVL